MQIYHSPQFQGILVRDSTFETEYQRYNAAVAQHNASGVAVAAKDNLDAGIAELEEMVNGANTIDTVTLSMSPDDVYPTALIKGSGGSVRTGVDHFNLPQFIEKVRREVEDFIEITQPAYTNGPQDGQPKE